MKGDLVYADVEVVGNSTISATPAYMFIPPAATDKMISLSLQAERLVVNWTDVTRYDVMNPSNLSRPYGGIQKGPQTQGERDHGTAALSASIRDQSANVLITSQSDAAPTVSLHGFSLLLEPNPSDHWMTGAHTRGADPTPDPNGSTVRVPLPLASVRARVHDAQLLVVGDIVLYIWEASVEVKDRSGTTPYASGTTYETQNPAGTSLPARERQTRLLTVSATNATLNIQLTEGEALLVGEAFQVDADGLGSFSSVLGVVGDRPIFEDKLTVDGKFSFSAQSSASEEDRLAGALHYDAADARVFGSSFEVHAPATKGGFPWMTTWILMGAASAVSLGTIGVRRILPIRIEEVELAILSGHERRAHSLARRLAQRQPRDPDVVFLYATTLLQRTQYGPVLEKIEPLAARMRVVERRGIAFVLAVAAHALGDKQKSARWANEAAAEPELAKKLAEGGLPVRNTPKSGHLQSGYA